jgi:hypothetical protein
MGFFFPVFGVLPQEPEKPAAPAVQEYQEAQWERATQGLDYSKDIEDAPATRTPPKPPIENRDIEASKWTGASKDIDYSRDQAEPPVERERRDESGSALDWTAQTQALGKILQILAIVLALLLISYGIYKMLQAPRNKKIARDGVVITAENVEQYLHETDLEHFLKDAIAKGNYSLAIRLYYLQIIKALSEKNSIAWSIEKTNRDYLREMASHKMAQPFRNITRTYERVWYGNLLLDSNGFSRMEPDFKTLLAAL